jgi:glutamate-1-semialdehyde aminotransferase
VAHAWRRWLAPLAPRSASEVARSRDGTLETLLHLYMLNRGVLITPFHSMLLMCPDTCAADVERYVGEFQGFCTQLAASGCAFPLNAVLPPCSCGPPLRRRS